MNFMPSIKVNYYRFGNLIFLVEKRNVHFGLIIMILPKPLDAWGFLDFFTDF